MELGWGDERKPVCAGIPLRAGKGRNCVLDSFHSFLFTCGPKNQTKEEFCLVIGHEWDKNVRVIFSSLIVLFFVFVFQQIVHVNNERRKHEFK